MRGRSAFVFFVISLATGGCATIDPQELVDCVTYGLEGFRPVATQRTDRFLGKVDNDTARCRGGQKAVDGRKFPWVDWQNYWAAGDAGSRSWGSADGSGHLPPNGRGIDGALLDLEYQRMELIRFNLFDNSGTYEDYVKGRMEDGKPRDGPALKVWQEMRLPRGHPQYEVVGGDGPQTCRGELIRFRTLTGICNDLRNPLMGSTGQPFARNVEFETTFPDLGKNDLVKNRHGDRLGLLKPDPQVISRTLFTRNQSQPDKCRMGLGLSGNSPDAACDYKKAPSFNVLAAFWIQFMTHDWFSHLEEGHNREVNGKPDLMPVGCMAEAAAKLGCRPDDRMDRASIAEEGDPPTFTHQGKTYLTRAYKTTRNTVTAWWDASQMYGYDERSHQRVKRDPKDPAKLLMITVGRRAGEGEQQG